MTLLDLLIFTAGIGLLLTFFLPASGQPPWVTPVRDFAELSWAVGILVAFVLYAIAVGTTLVILERQIVYKRQARPAEWLAILLAVVPLHGLAPNLDDIVVRLFVANRDWTSCRWIVGGTAALVVFGGLAVVRCLRPWLPYCVQTVLLAALAGLWFWLPVDVFARQLPWAIFPPNPFQTKWLLWLYVETANFVGGLPMWLPFGVPAVAALAERRCGIRRWIWTEWLATGAALLLGLLFLGVVYSTAVWDQTSDIVLRIVIPVWIGVVAALSWLIIWAWARFTSPHH